jgi:hypothetical protein
MLRQTPSSGSPDIEFDFGDPSGIPVVGDWNGNGVDTVGRYRSGTWELRDQFLPGNPDVTFSFGDPTGTPVVWGRVTT